jgi:hypothetical protein
MQRRVGIRNGSLFNNVSTLWNGLLAYYTADNTTNDALGAYNGTLVNGANYTTGKINNGFSFDGTNDYVDLGDNFDNDGSQTMSYSFWVNFNNTTSNRTIFGKYLSGQILQGLSQQSNSTILFTIQRTYPSNMLRVSTVNTFSVSTWYNVVVTYDGSKNASGVKIYINNVEATYNIVSDNFTGNSSNSGSFKIGHSFGYFYGKIDDFSIWNRVITPTEVGELYNSGAGKQYPN